MDIKSAFSVILISIIFLGCKKDGPPAPIPYDLIVEGGISTYKTRQYIRLSKPITFDLEKVQTVNNAKVVVNDGTNDIVFKEISTTGIYSGVVEHNKNFGATYTLTVEYDKKQYTASDILIPVYPIDENYIPVTVTTKQGGLRLTIPKHTFGTSSAQQWLILTQDKTWSQEKFKESYPFSYSHVFGTPNALNPLTQQARIIDLGINDNVNIYKFSLSDAYSTFLYNIFQETDWKGLLSSVPGNVKGNISGNANGFFYATDVEMQTRSLKSLMP